MTLPIPLRTIGAGAIDGIAGVALELRGVSFTKLGVGSYRIVLSRAATPSEVLFSCQTLTIGGAPAINAKCNVDHVSDTIKDLSFVGVGGGGGGGTVAFLVYNGTSDTIDFQTNIQSVTKLGTGVYDVILSVPAPPLASSLPLGSVITGAPRIMSIDEFDVGPTRTYRVRTWTQADATTAADTLFRLGIFDAAGGGGGGGTPVDVQFSFTFNLTAPQS